MNDPILSPSEQQFRQRVRDLEACVHLLSKAASQAADVFDALDRDNARLRRALRVLVQLQPERVRRAVMEVINDAR
jgi:predicted transcriptional regulator